MRKKTGIFFAGVIVWVILVLIGYPTKALAEETLETYVETSLESGSLAELNSETMAIETKEMEPAETEELEQGTIETETAEDIAFGSFAAYTNQVNQKTYEFVERLYIHLLDREGEEAGILFWHDLLVSGERTGVEVASGFVDSVEFAKRNLSDDAYVRILYRTFLGREAEAGGAEKWVALLQQGMSRAFVYQGVANSQEFYNLCESYGILCGTADVTEPRDKNEGITRFVYRNYVQFLGREAEISGLNAWANVLLTGKESPGAVAYGFVFSQEFKNRRLNNQAYVEILYRGMFGREGEAAGVNAWLSVLASGISREQVFLGFAKSVEFQNLVKSFEIAYTADDLDQLCKVQEPAEQIKATAWIAVDAYTGDVLYSKAQDSIVQLASQTKIMTATLVLEKVKDLNTTIKMTSEALKGIDSDTTICGLIVGNSYSVRSLLEGMLVYSGADCANLLAIYVAGSQSQFVAMMNAKATAIGMTNTYFSDPVGLTDNHSTPREYMKLVIYAMKNATFNEIVSMPSCVISNVRGYSQRRYYNSNYLVRGTVSYDRNLYIVDGVKTGFIEEAGYCLTASAYNAGGNRVLAAVFNTTDATQRSVDAKTLLDLVFTRYNQYEIVLTK